MTMICRNLLVLISLLASPASAQTHLLGLGPSNLLDTYLSQEKFKGTGFTYLYIREATTPRKHWHNIIEHEIDLAKANDRSGSISMLEGDYNLYWGRYRRFNLVGDEHADLDSVLMLADWRMPTSDSSTPCSTATTLHRCDSA